MVVASLASYEVSESSKAAALDRERTRRTEVERDLRKEKDVNAFEMEKRLEEMYVIQDLQSQIEGLTADRALLKVKLDMSYRVRKRRKGGRIRLTVRQAPSLSPS